MDRRPEILFNRARLSEYLDKSRDEALAKVRALPAGALTSEEQVVSEMLESFAVNPLELVDGGSLEKKEVQLDGSQFGRRFHFAPGESTKIDGFRFELHVEYTGSPVLLRLQPSTYSSNPPRAAIVSEPLSGPGKLVIAAEGPASEDVSYFKRDLEPVRDAIATAAARQTAQIEEYHRRLEADLRKAIAARLKRLDAADQIASELGIPLKPRPGSPALPVELNRKIPTRPSKPSSKPAASGPPERTISERDYEDILSIIRHQCRTFEGAPATFSKLEEEELRQVLLSSLNAVYQGDATGETFRGAGKTDIRIEADDRSAFVAEAKVWSGPAAVGDALDQLLDYLTWRDCKTLLLVFNKTVKGFADLRAKLRDAVAEHPCTLDELGDQPAGEWRFRFKGPNDDGHELTVHVMAFNLFS